MDENRSKPPGPPLHRLGFSFPKKLLRYSVSRVAAQYLPCISPFSARNSGNDDPPVFLNMRTLPPKKPSQSVTAEYLTVADLPTQISQRRKALTVSDLSSIISLSTKKIYELVAKGAIPYYRIAGSIRFDPKLIADWLRSQAA